jgi:NADPH:quinone reductase-like Zn-dependent oxidoreductase
MNLSRVQPIKIIISKMKAVQIKEYGAPEVLQLVEAPVPGIQPNEVLIKIKAAGVNGIDVKIRAGYLQKVMPFVLPKTLGWDAAGIVTELGSDITRFKVGDEVYGVTSFSAGGSYAEFMAAAENEMALKPTTLSFIEAASLPIISTTAYNYLFKLAGLKSGQKILIVGAAGGVGAIAVQMAREAGALVTGVVSTKDLDYIRSLGASEVIDFTKPGYLDAAKDMDLVLDLVGGPKQNNLFATLKRGGVFLSTVQPPSEELAQSAGVRAQFASTKPDYTILEKVAKMVDEGKLKLNVGKIFPLNRAVEAHQLLEKGKTGGKIVLVVE